MTFYDRVISPIVEAFKENILKDDIVTQDLDEYTGLSYPFENPSVFLKEQLAEDVSFYDKMLRDDDIDKSLNAMKSIVLSVPWSIEPASDDDKDVEAAEFVKEMFNNIGGDSVPSFLEALDNMLDARAYGYTVTEKTFGMYEGKGVPDVLKNKLCIKQFKSAHPRFFDFDYDEYRNLREMAIGYRFGAVTKLNAQKVRDKFVIFTYPYAKNGNLYGQSDLDSIYPLYFSKLHTLKHRNIYNERCGFPMLEILYDKSSKQAKSDIENLKRAAREKSLYTAIFNPAERNADGELQGLYKINKHDLSTAEGSDIFSQSMKDDAARIRFKLLVLDKMGLAESESNGGYSLSHDQLDTFKAFVRNFHRMLEEVMQPVVKQVVSLNYDVSAFPKFRFADDWGKLNIDALEKFINTGVVDYEEPWIRSEMGIPELTEEQQRELEDKKEKRKPAIPQMPMKENEIIGRDESDEEETPKEEMKSQPPYLNFKAVEKQFDTFEADFISSYSNAYSDITKSIRKQIEKKYNDIKKNTRAIESIVVNKTEMKRLFSRYYARLYFAGKSDAIEEVDSRLKRIETFKAKGVYEEFIDDEFGEEWLDRTWLNSWLEKYGELGTLTKEDKEWIRKFSQDAFLAADNEAMKILREVRPLVKSGIERGDTAKDIVKAVDATLNTEKKKYARTIARTVSSDYYNTGRMNFFNSDNVEPFVEAYEYTAILDDVTTDFCRTHDGQIIKKDDPMLARITPPNHFNCRSLLLPVMVGENELEGERYYNYETKFTKWGGSPRLPDKKFGGVAA